MKLTRIFGIVLGLHVVVIALVMLQPGCQSGKQGTKPDANSTSALEPNPLDSFNRGSRSDQSEDPDPINEFVSPSRPKPGEIIVPGGNLPGNPTVEDPAAETTLGEAETTIIPQDLTVYKIQRGDTLWGVARKNQISLSTLLGANPKISQNSKLSIGQEILIPTSGSQAEPITTPPPTSDASGANYIVKPGDNLSRIAQLNGVSLADLMSVNQLNKSSIIRPGQSLVIPESTGLSTQPVTPSVNPVPAGATTHIVKKGDNLTRIGLIYGVSIKQIMDWNGLTDAGKIRVGQSLIVSGSSSPESNAPTDEVEEQPQPSANESLENFFKGTVEERPVVVEPEENP